MKTYNQVAEIEPRETFKGWQGRMIHSASMTVAYFRGKAGHPFPEHSHPHEQISNIMEGELEITIGGVTRICKAGDVAIIPPNTVHVGKAITDVFVIDVFSPVREDYR